MDKVPAMVFVLSQFTLPPLLALAISAVYFFTSPRSQPLPERLLASAHGVALAGFYVSVLLVFWTGNASPKLEPIFLLSLLIPWLLIVPCRC
jgi:hypothetical protein